MEYKSDFQAFMGFLSGDPALEMLGMKGGGPDPLTVALQQQLLQGNTKTTKSGNPFASSDNSGTLLIFILVIMLAFAGYFVYKNISK